MESLLRDVKFAARMLVKNPGLTAVAAATLALGIGANTAIFSVVESALLRPLPYADPDRLAIVTIDRRELGSRFSLSKADFLILKDRMRSVESLAAFTPDRLNLTGGSEPERVSAMWVSAEFFSTLGVPAILGRTFLSDEDRPGRPPVAVISHELWRRRFAGDPGAIGRPVIMNDRSYTVVGVMPPDFTALRATDVWPILQLEPPVKRPPYYLKVVGRLKPGVEPPRLRAELSTMHDEVERAWPDPQKSDWGFAAAPMKDFIVGDVRPALLTLLAAVGFVLLIAMANVANLLLSRATSRAREIAVRSALGASRGVLVRQLLTESLMLAVLGGGTGLLLALWGVELLPAIGSGTLPRLGEVSIDRGVLVFTALISLASGVLFGLAPAMQMSRARLNEALKEGARTVSEARAHRRLRGLLVVAQMALALMLLVAAGLMGKSLERLRKVDPGFEPRGLLTAQLSLPRDGYPEPRQQADFYERLVQRLRDLPGVVAAGVSSSVPPENMNQLESFEVEGRPVPVGQSMPLAEELVLGGDLFRTLGISMLKGRPLAPSDRADDPPVAVISETMARRYFPGGDAIGRRFHAGGFGPEDPWITVVGVARDVRFSGLRAGSAFTIYLPYAQSPWWGGEMYVDLRTTADPGSLLTAVRRTLQALDPALPLSNIRTGEELVSAATGRPLFQTALIALFALLALLLAAVGIYGVISYTTVQRTHEIGVRLALGARRRDVVALVVGQGMRLALLGVGAGILGAFALTRLMQGLLFGVSPTDPRIFTVFALLLAGVAFVACYLPARRATLVDPNVALRCE
jgi:putative ABC transport system permease protein